MLIISHAISSYKHANGGSRPPVIFSNFIRGRGALRWPPRAAFLALFVALTAFSARASQAQQIQWPKSITTDSSALTLGLLQVPHPFSFKLPASPATDTYFLRVPFTSWVSNWENRLRSTLEQERYAFLRPAWANVTANKELPVEVAVEPTIAAPDTAGRG